MKKFIEVRLEEAVIEMLRGKCDGERFYEIAELAINEHKDELKENLAKVFLMPLNEIEKVDKPGKKGN